MNVRHRNVFGADAAAEAIVESNAESGAVARLVENVVIHDLGAYVQRPARSIVCADVADADVAQREAVVLPVDREPRAYIVDESSRYRPLVELDRCRVF